MPNHLCQEMYSKNSRKFSRTTILYGIRTKICFIGKLQVVSLCDVGI